MQRPKNYKEINTEPPKESFEGRAKKLKEEAAAKVRRSFTIDKKDLDKVEKLALKLSNQRGKLVSASEALRIIIEEYEV